MLLHHDAFSDFHIGSIVQLAIPCNQLLAHLIRSPRLVSSIIEPYVYISL